MAEVGREQGGPSTARRKRPSSKARSQVANDWPEPGETRSRASRRSKRHVPADIDVDVVETPTSSTSSSSDEDDDVDIKTSSRTKLKRRRVRQRRREPASSTSTTSDSDTSSTPPRTPLKSPRAAKRSSSSRVPNASDSAPNMSRHHHPTYVGVIEEAEDDDEVAQTLPSRPASRQTVSRRDVSPRSVHRYRSTPESRRSPRTPVSDSDDDATDATSDSDDRIHLFRRKQLPAVPSAPPPPNMHNSLKERLGGRDPDETAYEDDADAISRYAPSTRHRSRSRPPENRRDLDEYRRPRDITVSSPPSVDETRSRSRSRRPSKRHYESDAYVSRPSSSQKRLHAASSQSLSSEAKRSTLFGGAAASSVHPARHDKMLDRLTTCVSCGNEATPVSRTVKLKCLHRMCHNCLHYIFMQSLTDPHWMPPRCCTSDHIPLKHVANMFDANFKREWNRKYIRYCTKYRLYCPSRHCGEWIRPEEIRREGGRKHGRCSRCKIKICGSCSGKWHQQPECPRDPETAQLLEQARREARQRCYRCQGLAQLTYGHDHIVCRCGAEFCVICGEKWKTCSCPLFEDAGEEVVPGQLDIRRKPFNYTSAYESRAPSPTRDYRSDFVPMQSPTLRVRPTSYDDEVFWRRMHDRQRDEHLARRMHSFDVFGHHESHVDRAGDEDYEYEEQRGRRRRPEKSRSYPVAFLDDDYRLRRAATVVAPSSQQPAVPEVPAPARSAFEPPSRPALERAASAFDYPTTTPRSRRMRQASPEGYGEYTTNHYTPERRCWQSPEKWQGFSSERRARSHDRRHTYPVESRAASPDGWQQLPTRFPSPERIDTASEPRRRAHSLERPRASSLERRLADRFNPETRAAPAAATIPTSPAGPVGHHLGTLGPLGPLSPAMFPPHPPPLTAPGAPAMPMVSMPPPAMHGVPHPPAMLRHPMEEDMYHPGMHGALPSHPGPADWYAPASMPHTGMPSIPHPHAPDMLTGPTTATMDPLAVVSPRTPNFKRRLREHHKMEPPRSSVLAGLAGPGRGMHRVYEWVNYVEPGPPDAEPPATVV